MLSKCSCLKLCLHALTNFIPHFVVNLFFPDPLTSYIDNEYQANPPKQKVTINMKALSGNLTEKLVAGTTECSVKLQGHILGDIASFSKKIRYY